MDYLKLATHITLATLIPHDTPLSTARDALIKLANDDLKEGGFKDHLSNWYSEFEKTHANSPHKELAELRRWRGLIDDAQRYLKQHIPANHPAYRTVKGDYNYQDLNCHPLEQDAFVHRILPFLSDRETVSTFARVTKKIRKLVLEVRDSKEGTELRRLWLGLKAKSSINYRLRPWVQTLNGHKRSVKTVIAPQDGWLASGSDDNTIKIWKLNEANNCYQCVQTIAENKGFVTTLTTLDGRLISGSNDNTIKIWKLNKTTDYYNCVQTITEHTDSVTTVMTLNGRLVSRADDNIFKIWKLNETTDRYECVQTNDKHKHFVHPIKITQDGRLVSPSYMLNLTITKFDVTSHDIVLHSLLGELGPRPITVLQDGRLVSITHENALKFWKLNEGAYNYHCEQTIDGLANTVMTNITLHDGQLVSCFMGPAHSEALKIWKLNEATNHYECVQTLYGHDSAVYTVIALQNGWLVSASADDLKIWQFSSLATYLAPQKPPAPTNSNKLSQPNHKTSNMHNPVHQRLQDYFMGKQAPKLTESERNLLISALALKPAQSNNNVRTNSTSNSSTQTNNKQSDNHSLLTRSGNFFSNNSNNEDEQQSPNTSHNSEDDLKPKHTDSSSFGG